MAKLSKEVKNLSIVFIIIILLVVGGFSYSIYKISQDIREDYTNKMLVLNENFIKNLNTVKQDLEQDIFGLKTNLSLKLNLVENNLKNFRDQSKKDLNTLNNLIEQIDRADLSTTNSKCLAESSQSG